MSLNSVQGIAAVAQQHLVKNDPSIAISRFLSAQTSHAQTVLRAATEKKKKVIYVLDIEGNTTPLPFVTKVLFPVAEEQYESFVDAKFPSNETIAKFVEMAAKEHFSVAAALSQWKQNASQQTLEKVKAEFVGVLLELTKQNLKKPYLKGLQGMLWKEQYVAGKIKGHLFDDAAQNIMRWASLDDTEVHIYSSGSVQAQKLLFKYSSHGDLTPYLNGYYDTITAGNKQLVGSYSKIIKTVLARGDNLKREDVAFVFLSDNLGELKASSGAGFDASYFCIRPLNLVVDPKDLPANVPSIVSFDQLALNTESSVLKLKAETASYTATGAKKLKSFI